MEYIIKVLKGTEKIVMVIKMAGHELRLCIWYKNQRHNMEVYKEVSKCEILRFKIKNYNVDSCYAYSKKLERKYRG